MIMTEPLDLSRIKAYIAKATAEPWEIGHADIPDDWNLGERICAGGKVVAATIEPEYSNDPLAITREQGKAIATFIASARTDLPTAIAEIERLRAEVKEAKAAYAAEIASHRRTENLRVGMTQTYTRCTKERDELRQQLRNEQEDK